MQVGVGMAEFLGDHKGDLGEAGEFCAGASGCPVTRDPVFRSGVGGEGDFRFGGGGGGVLGGIFANSPAIHRWVRGSAAQSPVGDDRLFRP